MNDIYHSIFCGALSILLAVAILVLLFSDDEKSEKNNEEQTTEEAIDVAMRNILRNGYYVLDSLINEQSCDKLRIYLLDKYKEKKEKCDLSFNYFDGHYQIHLPNNIDYICKDILFNEKIHEILKNILGNNYYLSSYTCNANISKQNQPYHMDCSHFHPLKAIKMIGNCGPPHQIIINIYLQDTNQKNGSLDVVEKSHLITDFTMDENGIIDQQSIDQHKDKIKRCNYLKGSVILRDKRLWHRGTINHTENVRFMVSMTFTSKWLKLNTLPFDYDTQDLFNNECPFSTWNIEYV